MKRFLVSTLIVMTSLSVGCSSNAKYDESLDVTKAVEWTGDVWYDEEMKELISSKFYEKREEVYDLFEGFGYQVEILEDDSLNVIIPEGDEEVYSATCKLSKDVELDMVRDFYLDCEFLSKDTDDYTTVRTSKILSVLSLFVDDATLLDNYISDFILDVKSLDIEQNSFGANCNGYEIVMDYVNDRYKVTVTYQPNESDLVESDIIEEGSE